MTITRPIRLTLTLVAGFCPGIAARGTLGFDLDSGPLGDDLSLDAAHGPNALTRTHQAITAAAPCALRSSAPVASPAGGDLS